MENKMVSFKLDEMTRDFLSYMKSESGISATSLVEMAVNKLYRDLFKKSQDESKTIGSLLFIEGSKYVDYVHDYEETKI